MTGDLGPLWTAFLVGAAAFVGIAALFIGWNLKRPHVRDQTRRLPELPGPSSEEEADQFRSIRLHAERLGELPRITFDELVKQLWELYDGHMEHFPEPQVPELLARAIAWGVIKPSAEGIGEVLSLAIKYDTAIRLSFPMEMLDANLRRTAEERAAAA